MKNTSDHAFAVMCSDNGVSVEEAMRNERIVSAREENLRHEVLKDVIREEYSKSNEGK